MSYPLDDKATVEHVDHTGSDDVEKIGKAGEPVEQRVILTEEDNIRIRRKTDRNLLPLLVWVYFLQIFDKSVFGYGNTYGLSADLGLVGTQYSLASSMTSIAVLSWQPFSSYVLVRFSPRVLMTVFVFCWGVSETCMCAVTNEKGLYATRFLLGLFEAGAIPLFSMITSSYYRRSEQPLRVAAWFSQNAISTVVAALLSFGLGHITSKAFRPWQALYLMAGLLTVLTAPIVWWKLDSDVGTARFWKDEHERAQAIERLRANQTGLVSHQYKWSQVLEVVIDPKSWLFGALLCIPNIGANIANTFGPTLIKGFGFDTYTSTLLNIPFGCFQFISIMAGCWAASRFKVKSIMYALQILIALAGTIMLYVANAGATVNQALALVGYYCLACMFGVSPIAYAWAIANTAGQTKKSVTLSFMNLLTAVGQLTGPLLLDSSEAPRYLPGLRSVMIATGALEVAVGLLVVVLYLLNKQRQRQRVAAGKPEFIHDTSMDRKYKTMGEDEHANIGQNGLQDLTDFKNNEFVYVY